MFHPQQTARGSPWLTPLSSLISSPPLSSLSLSLLQLHKRNWKVQNDTCSLAFQPTPLSSFCLKHPSAHTPTLLLEDWAAVSRWLDSRSALSAHLWGPPCFRALSPLSIDDYFLSSALDKFQTVESWHYIFLKYGAWHHGEPPRNDYWLNQSINYTSSGPLHFHL